MNRLAVYFAVPFAALAVLAPPAQAQEETRLSSVEEAVTASVILEGRPGPTSVNWIDGGERFSYTHRNPSTRREEIRVYDPATRRDRLLLDPRSLTRPDTGEPLEHRSFQWAADSEHIVFQTDFRPIYRRSGVADFYVYSLEDETLRLAADDARTAELSPDGSMLGYERDGDLFVYEMENDRERRLTESGGDEVYNGVFGWVYEEEFGQAQAWRWSPDSRRIAFWQTDESDVPRVRITNYEGQHPEWTEIPYPKVGDENPEVQIGVADVASEEVLWLETGLEDEVYIPRIYWTSDPNTLAVVTLNRPQNHMRLFFFDVRTGARRLVFEETSRAWIDIYDFQENVDDLLHFPRGTREFFWISDRSGYQHIYRYNYEGELLGQVTEGPWAVTRIEGIDPDSRTLYYTSTQRSPLERHLYAVHFDGASKRRLTQAEGTHRVDLSPNGEWYIDRWSNTETPLQVELWSTAPEQVATLEDNQRTSEWLETHAYSPAELFRFTTRDSVRLDGSMIRPPDFDPSERHPVVLSIYGGPGSQQVHNEFATNGWHQYLAQNGYIVVGLNNRGSDGYGRDFREAVYGRLGELESRDFAEAARWLASQPWVDSSRMAIQGTSYGGYMAVYTMLRHPERFALGIANSPVTDWRLYDTIYTERYMGLLEDNPEGYGRSSTLSYADRLQGDLLLVHSAMDENVHPHNTMQLLTALTRAGRDADLRFYPPGAHGAAFDRTSYVTMMEVYTNQLCEHLDPDCTPQDLNR